jgi:urea transporter
MSGSQGPASGILSTWDAAAGRQPALRAVDVTLRGAGQVMFQDNPLTGLLFIVGIAWGAAAAGMPQVAIGAVLGLVVATGAATLLRVDQGAFRSGLYGFNGILVGAALPTFLTVDALLWVYIAMGAAVSTVAMLAIANVMKTWGVPALTFPFVLTTWLLLLGGYAFANIGIASMGPPAIPGAVGPQADLGNVQVIAETMLKGIAQVFLINDAITGIIFIVALAVSSVWAAVFAVIGTALAYATAVALGASGADIDAGLFGFSAVLTSIALGSVFHTPGLRVVVYTLLGVMFTVIVQGALDVVVTPFGIPTLTMPFVIVTWLFLLPQEDLTPTPHLPIAGRVVGSAPAATA